MTPTVIARSLALTSHSTQQTRHIGECLGRLLQAGDVVCLQGNLGAGKTCLCQGIGRALGVTSAITSPSFIIVNEYPLPSRTHKLYHIDLYRIETSAETRALGLEEYLYGDDLCVVEWAERALDILPGRRLWIILLHLDNAERELRFQALGERYAELLQRFSKDLGEDATCS